MKKKGRRMNRGKEKRKKKITTRHERVAAAAEEGANRDTGGEGGVELTDQKKDRETTAGKKAEGGKKTTEAKAGEERDRARQRGREREMKAKQMSHAAVTGADMKGWRARARRTWDKVPLHLLPL